MPPTPPEQNPELMKDALEAFLELFEEYASGILGSRDIPGSELLELRNSLQVLEPGVTDIICRVVGNLRHNVGRGTSIRTKFLLSDSLMGGNNAMPHNFRDFYAVAPSSVRRAIGTLKSGLWTGPTTTPVLTIHDAELKDRCLDLLDAPRNYDRVIVEATRILEDRIRSKPPHETLSGLIPNSSDQTLENMVNHFFSPDKTVLVISSDRGKRIAFHRMLLGVCSYLRNDYHHELDDETEWSWAWSTVGLIDRLLLEVDSCTLQPPT